MMKNKMRVLFFTLLLLFATITKVNADELITTNKGSFSLNLSDLETHEPIVGAQFAVYYIATIEQTPSGDIVYNYTEDYKYSGIPITEPSLASKLEYIVKGKPYVSLLTTDANGQANITNLNLGLYFVKQVNSVDGFALCQSFFVALPTKESGKYVYDIDASPKTEVEKLISISIKKEWKADKNAQIPQQVTVQLYKDNAVIHTAVLNESNNWEVKYDNLTKSDSYTVKEINVPKGYTAIYKQSGYSFTVTNVSSLIKTGQLVWPIPILVLTGIFCITTGLVFLRKSGKRNG